MMSGNSSSLSLEARLLNLESKLGVVNPLVTKSDIAGRLDTVKQQIDVLTTASFRETWAEIQNLLVDLDPGMALTHQQQPLLYRRQEVLAAASSLENDMRELSTMMHLLKQGQTNTATTTSSGGTTTTATNTANSVGSLLREDQVTQAPILTNFTISPEEERRLDALRLTLQDMQGRVQALMGRTDQLLESYHTVMAAASEKIVMADEAIAQKS